MKGRPKTSTLIYVRGYDIQLNHPGQKYILPAPGITFELQMLPSLCEIRVSRSYTLDEGDSNCT